MGNAKNSWCLFPSQMTADTLLHKLMCFYIVCMNTKVTRCLFVLDVLLEKKTKTFILSHEFLCSRHKHNTFSLHNLSFILVCFPPCCMFALVTVTHRFI